MRGENRERMKERSKGGGRRGGKRGSVLVWVLLLSLLCSVEGEQSELRWNNGALHDDDIAAVQIRPLDSSEVALRTRPLTPKGREVVQTSRDRIKAILDGKDDRLLVVVGPCSLHDREGAIDYAKRLRTLSQELERDLVVVMRGYLEKPRTTIGWKGLLLDPSMDSSADISAGLSLSRTLLAEIVELGVAVSSEILDLHSPNYLADLLSWGAIGARSVESQPHRELASALAFPIGLKSSTSGNIKVAVDAVETVMASHTFITVATNGQQAIVRSSGNQYGHVVLRGGGGGGEEGGGQFEEGHVREAAAELSKRKLKGGVMVDCSHANSRKDPATQVQVAQRVASMLREGGGRHVMGVMLESNIQGGAQKLSGGGAELQYGKSVTDPCIGWAQTEHVLRDLAHAVHARRAKGQQAEL